MTMIKIHFERKVVSDRMRETLKRLIEEFAPLPPPVLAVPGRWTPPVNVSQSGDETFIVAELSGVEKEDISVVIQGQILQISGVRHLPEVKHSSRFLQMEIEHGPFERIIRLPSAPAHADALYENGLLKIRLKNRRKRVPVKVEVK